MKDSNVKLENKASKRNASLQR